ncbi:unnamed protein product [Allacma fusca]|uniref:Uncharacterized protein n=1 Tax=Allacma fusca TaxID=39272 RepID=A0A8J2PW89_9HEXA|nr:unnamed protein product [Allacma fusca]
MPRYTAANTENLDSKSDFFSVNDKNDFIYDPTAPKLQFRNWLLGLDSTDEVKTTEASVDIDQDDLYTDDGMIISETTISFFLGSALLFFAALVLVLIIVAILKGIKHSQWKREQEAKKAECIRRLVTHPVRSLDVTRVDLKNALGHAKGENLLSF